MNEPSLSNSHSFRIDISETQTTDDSIKDQAESMMVWIVVKTNLLATIEIWSSCRIWIRKAAIEKETQEEGKFLIFPSPKWALCSNQSEWRLDSLQSDRYGRSWGDWIITHIILLPGASLRIPKWQWNNRTFHHTNRFLVAPKPSASFILPSHSSPIPSPHPNKRAHPIHTRSLTVCSKVLPLSPPSFFTLGLGHSIRWGRLVFDHSRVLSAPHSHSMQLWRRNRRFCRDWRQHDSIGADVSACD